MADSIAAAILKHDSSRIILGTFHAPLTSNPIVASEFTRSSSSPMALWIDTKLALSLYAIVMSMVLIMMKHSLDANTITMLIL